MGKPSTIFNEAIRLVVDVATESLRTIIPGRVQLPKRQTNTEADVSFEPGPGRRQAGTEVADGVVDNAPVMYPGGGGFAMRWPLTTGDEALGLVADRNIQRWRQTKIPGQAHGFSRHHNISDAVVFPFAITAPEATPPNWATDFVLMSPTGVSIQIAGLDGAVTVQTPAASIVIAADGTVTVTGTTVKLGGASATLGVARLNDTTSSDTTMTAWMASVQTVCSAAAAFLGLTPPVYPSDFGKVTAASAKVLSE